jgi:hypothetical protein
MTSSNARAKLDAIRREEAARARRRRLIGVGSGAVVLLVVVLLISWAVTRTPAQPTATSGLATYPGLSRNHVTGPVTYQQTPPAGGPHASVWQNCGIYTNPVPSENAVHCSAARSTSAPCSPTLRTCATGSSTSAPARSPRRRSRRAWTSWRSSRTSRTEASLTSSR